MRRLAFAIHDMNSWGGQDRSTLEIAKRLSHRWPVDVCSFTLEDAAGMGGWGDVTFRRVRPRVARPLAAKIAWYHGASLPLLAGVARPASQARPLVHATGPCALVSDVVQVQFVASAWREIRRRLPPETCEAPFARGARGPATWARRLNEELLLELNARLEKLLYSSGKTYIAISDGVARELRRHFGLDHQVRVVRHGVDSEAFRPARSDGERAERARLRAELGIGESEVAVAFVGAYERKGLAAAIDALARLPGEARARARLLAVGGGAIDGFKARARAAGVEERVCFVGHRKEIAPYYRAADLFLLPTFYEPFGLVALEAMASRLPVVVSRAAGAAELVPDGEAGSLIDEPTDAGEIARKLAPWILDPVARARAGARAREIAEARSWEVVADEYARVLGPLLEGKAR